MKSEHSRNPVEIGTVLGQYRVDAVLGEGGMGVVYRAFDTKLNRPVAVKFLSDAVADKQARRRFQREAQTASSLNHPHIVTVHDAGEWNGQQYLVTEFVDGGTLSNWAAESRSWRQCAELLTGVAEGLAAAHEAHILHRDIKPGNILVSQNGYAKLADFGLARLDDNVTVDETRTRPGVILGTTAYMSPEQATGGKCDARSDIFSLGIVLYELLSGKRPFEGKSPTEILQKIVHQQPSPLPDSIPPALRNLVEKALEKEPGDRYQSVREIVVDLRRVTRRTEPGSEIAASVPPGIDTRRSRRWIPAAGLVLIAGLVLALIFRGRTTGTTTGELQRFQIVPPPGGRFLVSALANVGGLAVSPDGKTLAFVATQGNQTSLWIQTLNGIDGSARRIEGTQSVQRPFWSPDSKSVAYFGGGGLYRVEAAGGAPALILAMNTVGTMSGSWSEDGTILFSRDHAVFAIPASGSEPTPKPLLQTGSYPQALPGGGAFLYWYWNEGNNPAIYVATIANPAGKLLVGAGGLVGYASGYLLWRDGTSLLAQPFDPRTLTLSGEPQKILQPIAFGDMNDPGVTVSTTGRLIYDAKGSDQQLAWYARTSKIPESLGGPGRYQGFRIFDNGRRVMIQVNALENLGLSVIDEHGRSNRAITTGIMNPTASPDGRSLVYSDLGRGLFRADVSGENRVALKTSEQGGFTFPTDWSGNVLLFTKDLDIWSVRLAPDGNLAPDAVPEPYLQTSAVETSARFAPDLNQKWVAYQSNELGHSDVYVRSFRDKGEKVKVSDQGGSFPVWGPGGRELFYVAPDNKLMAVDITFSKSSVSASTAHEVFPLPPRDNPVATPFDTIDGQRFLVLSSVAPDRPLQLIDNWPVLLKH